MKHAEYVVVNFKDGALIKFNLFNGISLFTRQKQNLKKGIYQKGPKIVGTSIIFTRF